MPKLQIETRQVCDTCGQLFGGFHKHCDGTWVGQRRGVTPWETVAAGSYAANCFCVDEHGATCPEFGHPSATGRE